MTPIQGTNAVLSFDKNGFVPFVCATNIDIGINTEGVPSRTVGDGPWKKTIYQTISYTLNMSGVLVFNEENFGLWELIKNQIGFLTISFRMSYTDMEGTTKSFQGICSFRTSQLTASVGDVVKGSISVEGNGRLAQFDGFIPCPSAITGITVDTTGVGGNASITYSYTGDVYQVKYQLNGTGPFGFASGGDAIVIAGLAIGDYYVLIIPVCTNGYEGTPLSQDFTITNGAVCSSVISNIVVVTGSTVTATNVHSGAATQMRYRIDGGIWIMALIDAVINMTGLPPGNHTLEEQPMCQFGTSFVPGTGFTRNFTIVSTPTISPVNYQFINNPTLGNSSLFQIYNNGILQVNETTAQTGSFTANIGVPIKVSVTVSGPIFINAHIRLQVKDVTTGIIIHDETQVKSGSTSKTINFTFTNDADTHLVTITVSA